MVGVLAAFASPEQRHANKMCSDGFFRQRWPRKAAIFPTRFHIASCSVCDETAPAVRCGKYDQHIWKAWWISGIAWLMLPVVLKCCRHTWLTKLPPSPWRQLRHWQRLSFFFLLLAFIAHFTVLQYVPTTKSLNVLSFFSFLIFFVPVCPFIFHVWLKIELFWEEVKIYIYICKQNTVRERKETRKGREKDDDQIKEKESEVGRVCGNERWWEIGSKCLRKREG